MHPDYLKLNQMGQAHWLVAEIDNPYFTDHGEEIFQWLNSLPLYEFLTQVRLFAQEDATNKLLIYHQDVLFARVKHAKYASMELEPATEEEMQIYKLFFARNPTDTKTFQHMDAIRRHRILSNDAQLMANMLNTPIKIPALAECDYCVLHGLATR